MDFLIVNIRNKLEISISLQLKIATDKIKNINKGRKIAELNNIRIIMING